MIAHSNSINTIFALILLAALAGGCTIIYPSGTPYLIPTTSGTNGDLPPLTRVPSLTPTKTDIPTLTPYMAPSLTPIPTLAGEYAKSKVAYLLETNGNCSLPCWWGITPGRTTWSEAEHYMATFALGISPAGFSQQRDLALYNVEFPDPNSNSLADYLFAGFAVNNSGVIEIIDSTSKKSLSTTLDNIGIPSQIWVEIISNFGPGPLSYTLALFYNDGVMEIGRAHV
jgi:hypothetical protein